MNRELVALGLRPKHKIKEGKTTYISSEEEEASKLKLEETTLRSGKVRKTGEYKKKQRRSASADKSTTGNQTIRAEFQKELQTKKKKKSASEEDSIVSGGIELQANQVARKSYNRRT